MVKPSTTHTHLSHHSPQRRHPQAAERRRGGAGGARDFTSRARVTTASTRRTHLAPAHTSTRALPPPPVAGSPKLPPRLPRRRAHAALQAPLLSRRGPLRSQSLRLGRLRSPRSPPPLQRAPRGPRGSGTRGLGRPWPRPGAPGRALPSPALRPQGCSPGRRTPRGGGRSGLSRAASGRHRLSWRSGWLRLRDAASPPGGPSRGLCVSAGGARPAGWRAVSCAGREA